jgi:Ion channel
VAFWILFPLLGDKLLVQILFQILVLNSVLVSLSATAKGSRIKTILWIIWGIGMLGSIMGLLPVAPEIRTAGLYLESILHFILLIICIAIILSTVFGSHRVTVDAIFAAFVAYLLMAFSFALIYRMMILWNPESFTGAISKPLQMGDMAYFSLVTIATLGYGDIIPASNTARMISVLEAVLGQFYVAVIIAVLVGTYISQRFESQEQNK